MIAVTLHRPWLVARLPRPMRLLSHAPFGGGFTLGRTVLWREVRNADLPQDFPVEDWFPAEVAQAPAPAEVAMLTSRDIGAHVLAEAEVEGVRATALVTLGLSNAESVGRRLPWHPADRGTINALVALDTGLSDVAMIEALAIAVQARTAAVMELGLDLATGRATGTGTDCITLACDPGAGRYAGLHTPVGEALGAAMRAAVARAGQDWLAWRAAKRLSEG